MRKTFIPMFLALAYGGLTADAQTSLVVNPASQSSESKTYLLSDIAKITFGDHGMEINGTSGTKETISLSDIMSLKFISEGTGINGLTTTEDSSLVPYYRGGMLGADGLQGGRPARIRVCDLSGRVIIAKENWDGTPISTSSLTKGVYLFSVNKKTIKFMK